ncbi:MAG: S41 family peptidase [Bacteroidales bacterium]|nr:S41 family peptidase [Bacteroidales bacterium]
MKKRINKRALIYISLFSIALLSVFSFKVLDDGDDFEIAKSFDIFHNVIREIRLFYVDDADISKLINESTTEFLEKLDPYTVFYSESQMEEYTFMTTGAYGGIGAMIIERNNALLLTNIHKNSPADKASLKVGDEIIAINGIKISEKNISEIKPLLKGEPGSKINISVKRFGSSKNIEKIITREKITLENIPHSEILDNKYAYVKLNAFKFGAGGEIKNKLAEMNSESELKGVILDLRGNPGGLLNEAVNIVSLFVGKGNEIVSTKGRISQWNYVYKAQREPVFPDIPVVILINSRSASASEIVAGALQDLDRAVIIGQRSFGKGLVQTTRKLSYNTRIKITTAKYYIPSGRCIQAIDYSHRNEDGSIGHIPDSLISEFKTKAGRTVFDGGGIIPDIKVPNDSLSSFTEQLIQNSIIFDFATKFFYENDSIKSAESFNISEKTYNDFTEYVINKNIRFNSESLVLADRLLKIAQKEKFNKDILKKTNDLRKCLVLNKNEALTLYKPQITPILNSEIIRRYYYNTGQIIFALKFDKELDEAKNILDNKDKYNLLLSGIND